MLNTANGKQPLNVSFELEKRKLLALYGPSGVGKTTILRILAGLTGIENGCIEVNGETWYDPAAKKYKAVQQRSIGFVFQDFALFPNFTVKQNLEFALQKGDNKKFINELIEIMELQQLQKSKPATLSGGQKQRVALARALVRKPELLLLDEPLSAIDNELRLKLQDILINIHRRFHLTTVLVSHDIAEIIRLSDTVIVLESGEIKQQGSPADIFFNQQENNKFFLRGDLISIKKTESNFEVAILHGNEIIKFEVEKVNGLEKGDKVIITSEVFKPVIQKC